MVNFRKAKAVRLSRQGSGLAAFLGFVFLFGMLMYGLLQDDNLSGTEIISISTPARNGYGYGQEESNHHRHTGMRILYIVTSSTEFNTGDKKTKKGQDRFLEILVPALVEGVESMVPEYKVDVCLILGYTLSEDRQVTLQELLPKGVGLQVWNQATPISYEQMTPTTKQVYLSGKDRTLARQHRYVVKDKLPYYDFFLAFEDDMLITKSHIEYYMDVTQEINAYKKELADEKGTDQSQSQSSNASPTKGTFWGPMTKEQLDRLQPGFLRVEVLTDPERPTKPDMGPIPVFGRARPDPRVCCHTNRVGLQGQLPLAPQYPTADQLVIWETGIAGLFVREMPTHTTSQPQLLDWVALLPIRGPAIQVDGYWSGTQGALGPSMPKKPSSTSNEFFGQSAGWMASRKEIMEFDQVLCKGGFLPPFDPPWMGDDGMGYTTDHVEFWSGGFQLWGQMCEMQRIVSLDPRQFSRHLLYHTANNKQVEITSERLVKVSTLFGQLHSVKHKAQAEMQHRLDKESIFYEMFQAIGLYD
jgi:hypothetical protein